MKTRRHHNTDGRSQIRRGKTGDQVARIAKRLNIPYKTAALDRIEVYQWDWIPGFAAFINDGTLKKSGTARIALNVGAIIAAVEARDIAPSDVPLLVGETIIHEIGHALEAWCAVEFSEARVEALAMKYRAMHGVNPKHDPTGSVR